MGNTESFADILKELLIELELNQSQFAAKIGLKQSQVSEWLKGKSNPGYDSLKAICSALGVSADRLLGLTND